MRPLGIWSLVVILVSLGSAAFAEGIPEQTIQNQHKSCVQSCIKSSGGQTEACEQACTCVDAETQKNFSAAEFTELERQIAANPGAPTFTPDIKAKVDAVFSACRP